MINFVFFKYVYHNVCNKINASLFKVFENEFLITYKLNKFRQCTAMQVKTENNDACLLLINVLPHLINLQIPDVKSSHVKILIYSL